MTSRLNDNPIDALVVGAGVSGLATAAPHAWLTGTLPALVELAKQLLFILVLNLVQPDYLLW